MGQMYLKQFTIGSAAPKTVLNFSAELNVASIKALMYHNP